MPATIDTKTLGKILAAYQNKPVTFNEKVLARPPYWDKQAAIARSVRRNKTTVVATGNSVGKSYLAAGLALWWLFTRPESLVVATAPSQTLLATVLFKEIRRAVESSRINGVPLPCDITDSAKASPQVVSVGAGWQALGISTRGVERLSGQHNPYLLVLVDEASGVLAGVWESLISLNPYKLVIFGNPLCGGNEFERAYRQGLLDEIDPTISNDRRTQSFKIPSTESPDIHLERSPRGLADRGFLHDAEKKWGRGTLLWQTHIEAIFPEKSADGLLEPDWIDRCFTAQPTAAGRLTLAVDISAGVGADRTVILVRDDNSIKHLFVSKFAGMATAAGLVHSLASQYRIPQDRLIYDSSGLGRNFPEYLSQYGIRHAIPYVGSASGHNSRGLSFTNYRASSAWNLRLRLDPDRPIPHAPLDASATSWQRVEYAQSLKTKQDAFAFPLNVVGEHGALLREELINLRYKPGLRIGLESKDEMSARLGRSPDLADALIMSFSLE